MNDKSTMNKIMEYMALGKPIVQFDLTEGRVSAEEASVYARNTDTAEFGDKILELIDDPVRRDRMGAFGRKRIYSELAWDHEMAKLLSAYEPIAKLPGDDWDCGSSRLAMIARRVFCKPALDHDAVDAMHRQFLDAVWLCGVSSLSNWAVSRAAARRPDRGQTINRKS
jgi:hypothetical protein